VIRWIKFNFVGAMGIVIQLGALFLLTALGMSYLPATAIAVECAVLHNFAWHERFTWPDRTLRHTAWSARLIRFNMSTGFVSIGGNLLLMRLLVGQVHLPAVAANVISIAGCSLVNFLVADKWVFSVVSGQWPVARKSVVGSQ